MNGSMFQRANPRCPPLKTRQLPVRLRRKAREQRANPRRSRQRTWISRRFGARFSRYEHLLKRQKRGLPTFSEWSSNNMDRETGPSLSNMPGMRISHCLKRSEEHTSELQSLMRISYAVFCLKKKKQNENK